MPQTPSLKRKSLVDHASERVFRPFKSPLHTRTHHSGAEVELPQSDLTSQLPGAASQANSCSQEDNNSDIGLIKSPSHAAWISSKLPSTRALTHVDTQVQELRSLEFEISNLRSENDKLSQALKLLSSPKTEELERLKLRWCEISRTAADELFVQIEDKVSQMGGVGAWKKLEQDRERRRNDFFHQDGSAADENKTDGHEEGKQEDSEELEEKNRLQREREGELAETPSAYDLESQEPRQSSAWEDCSDDDAFTMGTMLKLLNVDKDLLGYDRKAQRWLE